MTKLTRDPAAREVAHESEWVRVDVDAGRFPPTGVSLQQAITTQPDGTRGEDTLATSGVDMMTPAAAGLLASRQVAAADLADGR